MEGDQMRPLLYIFLCVAVLFAANTCFAAEQAKTEQWKENAKAAKLSTEAIKQLEKNRILIANQFKRQLEMFYTDHKSDLPRFITSDSLLNAYHLLFTESIIQLEEKQISSLEDSLKLIINNVNSALTTKTGKLMQDNKELAKQSHKRIAIVIGTALKLLDPKYTSGDTTIDNLIATEVQHITQANEHLLPEWFGRPDSTIKTIDYSRFKPRGFYTRSDELKQYFQAISWLQAIPFRISQDNELLAAMLLGQSISEMNIKDQDARDKLSNFFQYYKSFLGDSDDRDIITASEDFKSSVTDMETFTKEKQKLLQSLKSDTEHPLINDQIRETLPKAGDLSEVNYRIMSAYSLPDSKMFQQILNKQQQQQLFPAGLSLAAGLGSQTAKSMLPDNLTKIIADNQKYFTSNEYIDFNYLFENEYESYDNGDSLYIEYLFAIRALLDKPEADAPDFMQTSAWQLKNLNTALAGWAQLRHTWILQSKMCEALAGMSSLPAGFVEPKPKFYSRMIYLVGKTKYLLESAGLFANNNDRINLGNSWNQLEKICEKLEYLSHKQLRGATLSHRDESFIKSYGAKIGGIMHPYSSHYPPDDAPRIADIISDPNTGEYLHVGVAHPQAIYVLYPYQGTTYLCRGGIMPYYEFAHSTRLTDKDWLELIYDEKKCPKPPQWIAPIMEKTNE